MSAFSPLVSIVIPCYNAGEYLSAAIQSALDQTHPNCEVIVIDDGSTDGSAEVIQGFGDRIRGEIGPKRGGNPARNRGLELARGEYCQFLDGDDLLDPEKIENQLERFAADPDLDFMVGVARIWRPDSSAQAETETWGPDPDGNMETEWLRGKVAQTNTMLWKTSFLRSIGGWNEDFTSHQDNEVVLRGMIAGGKGTIDPTPRSTWRKWSVTSVSSDPRTRSGYNWFRLTGLFHQWKKGRMAVIAYGDEMEASVWGALRCISENSPSDAAESLRDAVADGRLRGEHWAKGGNFGRLSKWLGFRSAVILRRILP